MEDWYTRGEEAFLKAYGRYDIVLEKGEHKNETCYSRKT